MSNGLRNEDVRPESRDRSTMISAEPGGSVGVTTELHKFLVVESGTVQIPRVRETKSTPDAETRTSCRRIGFLFEPSHTTTMSKCASFR